MINRNNLIKAFIGFIFSSFFTLMFFSCASHPNSRNPGSKSLATGYSFNKGKDSFKVSKFKGQKVGNDLVFVEGGMMVVGDFDDDLTNSRNSFKRNVSVASFFIGKTPVVNLEWREYLDWLKKNSSEEKYNAALPDSNVWIRELAYNDPYIENYLWYPGFSFFPVVGVSYKQAVQYCDWRTKYVNNRLAKEAGYDIDFLKSYRSEPEEEQDEEDNETTGDENVMQDQNSQNIDGQEVNNENAVSEEGEDSDNSESEMQSLMNELKSKGVLLPSEYRLPTEIEWEYAARAMVGVQSDDFVQVTQKIYPWNGLSLRDSNGNFLANFKRSRGNYKGIAGESNYNGPTTHVYTYPPNELGIYDIVGNVCEYVSDVYRPNSLHDMEDFNPLRRDGSLDAQNDYKSSNPLINDSSIVYKGASWKDCAYWLAISKRRYIDKDSATATIGFRCAMTSAGD